MGLVEAFSIWVRIDCADVKGWVPLLVELMDYLYLTLVHPGFDKLRRGVGVIQRLRWYLFVVQDVVSLLACEGFCEWRVEMMEGLCFVFCCIWYWTQFVL